MNLTTIACRTTSMSPDGYDRIESVLPVAPPPAAAAVLIASTNMLAAPWPNQRGRLAHRQSSRQAEDRPIQPS
jgi:hypothetical protein